MEKLLHLLQLSSPALPVGAYSYSEGLEVLVDAGIINSENPLEHWLRQELFYGAIRIEAAITIRALLAAANGDRDALRYWNAWVSAAKETEELRQQSWQMGRSLSLLLRQLQPQIIPLLDACEQPCNYAIAFGIAAGYWQINSEQAAIGYLHGWATNLITAGIKLIPLGQTTGQKILANLHLDIDKATREIISLADDDLCSCNWGLALASMSHETKYSRLFRS